MIKYKLTNYFNRTFNNTKWGENITYETSGEGELCGPGWLHYYDCPILAILLNPIHANFNFPKLWECKVEGRFKHFYGTKSGCTKLTTLREIKLPKINIDKKIEFTILCIREICEDIEWNLLVDEWLKNPGRSAKDAKSLIFKSWVKKPHYHNMVEFHHNLNEVINEICAYSIELSCITAGAGIESKTLNFAEILKKANYELNI